MFDTIRVNPVTRIDVRHDVHEHKAPTDESVRLLRDMESKAQEQILKAIRVEDSPIDAVIHKMRDHLTYDLLFAVVLKINGKKLRADFRASEYLKKDEIAIGVRDAVATVIANELLGSLSKTLGEVL